MWLNLCQWRKTKWKSHVPFLWSMLIRTHCISLPFLFPPSGWWKCECSDTNRSCHFGSWSQTYILQNKIESGTLMIQPSEGSTSPPAFMWKKNKLLSCFSHCYFAAEPNPNLYTLKQCVCFSGMILIIMPQSLSSTLSYSKTC